MFNIFETEGETVQEQAKVSMLLKKVEHPQLQAAVGTLRIRAQMDNVFFTECANPIFARVSELPDYQLNRKMSGSDIGRKVKQNVSEVAEATVPRLHPNATASICRRFHMDRLLLRLEEDVRC
jgi:hypothetical protein